MEQGIHTWHWCNKKYLVLCLMWNFKPISVLKCHLCVWQLNRVVSFWTKHFWVQRTILQNDELEFRWGFIVHSQRWEKLIASITTSVCLFKTCILHDEGEQNKSNLASYTMMPNLKLVYNSEQQQHQFCWTWKAMFCQDCRVTDEETVSAKKNSPACDILLNTVE